MRSADDGPGLPAGSGVHVLEAPGMFDTMLFLRSIGQCKKTELYGAIGRRTGMALKLDRLEDAGLVIQERHRAMTVLSLSEEGCRVADMIEAIRGIIEEGEAPTDPRPGRLRSSVTLKHGPVAQLCIPTGPSLRPDSPSGRSTCPY